MSETSLVPNKRADKNWLDNLAFEVALEYFPPDELAPQYDLTMEQYETIAESNQFKRLVLEHRRQIDEKGTQFKVLARRLSTLTLPVLHDIAHDPLQDASDRINAAKLLASFSGFDSDGGDAQGFQVNIQINNT